MTCMNFIFKGTELIRIKQTVNSPKQLYARIGTDTENEPFDMHCLSPTHTLHAFYLSSVKHFEFSWPSQHHSYILIAKL